MAIFNIRKDTIFKSPILILILITIMQVDHDKNMYLNISKGQNLSVTRYIGNRKSKLLEKFLRTVCLTTVCNIHTCSLPK